MRVSLKKKFCGSQALSRLSGCVQSMEETPIHGKDKPRDVQWHLSPILLLVPNPPRDPHAPPPMTQPTPSYQFFFSQRHFPFHPFPFLRRKTFQKNGLLTQSGRLLSNKLIRNCGPQIEFLLSLLLSLSGMWYADQTKIPLSELWFLKKIVG